MLLSSKREFKDSHLFCQATTYPGHRFHMKPSLQVMCFEAELLRLEKDSLLFIYYS